MFIKDFGVGPITTQKGKFHKGPKLQTHKKPSKGIL